MKRLGGCFQAASKVGRVEVENPNRSFDRKGSDRHPLIAESASSMHFSKTYSQLLADLPPELTENAVEYRQVT
jgi:hypothetical protein